MMRANSNVKQDWMARAGAMQDQLVAWRRDFHMHPELGLQEVRTAGIVASELERLNYQVRTGMGQTGVVGQMAAGDGPVVLIRFDMDALPLQEENEVPYRSRHDGVMHACGHDGHLAIGLGVATILAKHQDVLRGTVKLMFQPGEEGFNGADLMIQDGLLDPPRPDVALAAHVWNDMPVGQVGVTPGPVMAASDTWECVIRGRGGHGAAPHQTADPVVAAAQLIQAWQTIVSRNVDPQKSAVVSVGSMHAGDAFNIIPESVTLQGTIRSFEPSARENVLQRFQEIAEGITRTFGCSHDLKLMPLTPALINDPQVTAVVRQRVISLVGEDNVLEARTMGSEDMAFVHQQIPGCYLFVGSQNEDAGLSRPHHNPQFNFDERALPLAVGLLTAAAAEYLCQP